MDAELKEEEEELERNKREGCLDSQFDLNLTRMLTNVKNTSFYRGFDHNRLIETIDGYDKRFTMDRFPKCHDRRIENGWSGCSLILRFKMRLIAFVGS